MKNKALVIAIAKDGGSKLIEYNGDYFFLDHAINSETKGVLFHGKNSRDGKPVKKELRDKIIASLEKL